IYGGLDRGPTQFSRTFGMAWGIGGWLLTPFLQKIGFEAAQRLRERVAGPAAGKRVDPPPRPCPVRGQPGRGRRPSGTGAGRASIRRDPRPGRCPLPPATSPEVSYTHRHLRDRTHLLR
ncbi:MAG TPA: hypothetical protein VMT79_18060, partial [Candidatus Binatia bacterium]|nr:hypothetical protein [Candidatus Binatia bacterium]